MITTRPASSVRLRVLRKGQRDREREKDTQRGYKYVEVNGSGFILCAKNCRCRLAGHTTILTHYYGEQYREMHCSSNRETVDLCCRLQIPENPVQEKGNNRTRKTSQAVALSFPFNTIVLSSPFPLLCCPPSVSTSLLCVEGILLFTGQNICDKEEIGELDVEGSRELSAGGILGDEISCYIQMRKSVRICILICSEGECPFREITDNTIQKLK